MVRLAEKAGVALDRLRTSDVRAVHAGFGAAWATVFDLRRAMAKRRGTGMPGPAQVARQLAHWRRELR